MAKYHGVVVAGTFDRLHDGHKKLLKAAASLSASRACLVVGITTEALLEKKVLAELIESFEDRKNSVEKFLRDAGPDLNVEIVPISEAVPKRGSTDPKLECIVVSLDTKSGADALNQKREENGVKPLQVVVIDMVVEGEEREERYLSSTLLRQRTLGTFIHRSDKSRLKRGKLSGPPYLVGLTGGIASGKTSICEMLRKKFNIHTINCDILAHKSYLPQTPTHRRIVETFGGTILHRAVRKLLVEERERVGGEGEDLCFVEAALMIEAGSQREMDELWVAFLSNETAKLRLMQRNQLGKEEAVKRINSQMASKDRVAQADVVIYNGWTLTETEQQIELAFSLLQDRMSPVVQKWKELEFWENPLFSRWIGLMGRLNVSDSLAADWWRALEERYTASWRRYHNLEEVQRLFKLYHENAHFIAEATAVQLAVFFHAAAYQPLQTHTLSAHFFVQFCKESNLDPLLERQVVECILSTEPGGDVGKYPTDNAAWFHDFQLGTFCEAWEECRRSAERWREELDLLNILNSSEIQASYLESLLKKPTLFATHPWKTSQETVAKEHIRKLIEDLKQGSDRFTL